MADLARLADRARGRLASRAARPEGRKTGNRSGLGLRPVRRPAPRWRRCKASCWRAEGSAFVGEVRWSFPAASDEVALENPNRSGLFLAGLCEKPMSDASHNANGKRAAKIRQIAIRSALGGRSEQARIAARRLISLPGSPLKRRRNCCPPPAACRSGSVVRRKAIRFANVFRWWWTTNGFIRAMEEVIELYEQAPVRADDRVLIHGDVGLHNLALDAESGEIRLRQWHLRLRQCCVGRPRLAVSAV